MPYRFLEDVATADIAFEAQGATLEEAFIAAAEATLSVMIDSPDTVQNRTERSFRLEDERLDMLLFNFLQELIYYKDAEQLLLRVRRVRFAQSCDSCVLEADTEGERLDPERHPQRVDVKAVTLHQFRLERTETGWSAFVILDI